MILILNSMAAAGTGFESPVVLLLSLLYSFVLMLAWIVVLVLGIARWKQVRRSLRAGLLFGSALLLVKLPGFVAVMVYLDDSIGMRIGVGFAFVFLIVGVFHGAIQIGLAQWLAAPRNAYPTLLCDGRRFAGWGLGAGLGLAAAVVTVPVFHLLGVEAGPLQQLLERLMPAVLEAPAVVRTTIAVFGVTAAAVGEEMIFRGVIQPGLTRLMGGSAAALVTAVLVTSAVWAVGHAANAEPIWVKLVQIFLLGLVFGWLARRHSVEAAIVAHIGLNLGSLAAAPLFYLEF